MKTTKSTFPDGYPTHMHKGKCYSLPYWLPESQKGKFNIAIEFKPAGTTLPIVSMRNAIFMGLKPCTLTIDQPMGIHTLNEANYGTWMTSFPQEIEQHHRQLAEMHGRVLVGGLGLGVAVALLEKNPRVKEIIVVEKSFDVLTLVGPHIPKRKTKLVNADVYDYLKASCKSHFNCAFYDIWCPTGETVLMKHTLPLRKLSEGVVKNRIECWNEDEMIGQVRFACQTEIMMLNDTLNFPTLLHCPDEDFQRYKKSRELVWFFIKWLREAKQELDKFCAALKQPRVLQEKWKVAI